MVFCKSNRSTAYLEQMAHSCDKENIVGLVKQKYYFMFQQTGRNGKTTSFKLKMQMQTYRYTLKSKNKLQNGCDYLLESKNKPALNDFTLT